jgi:hypothetical protein
MSLSSDSSAVVSSGGTNISADIKTASDIFKSVVKIVDSLGLVRGPSWSKSVTTAQRTLTTYFPDYAKHLSSESATKFGVTAATIQDAFYAEVSLLASHCDSNKKAQNDFPGKLAQCINLFSLYVWVVCCNGYLPGASVNQTSASDPLDTTSEYLKWQDCSNFLMEMKTGEGAIKTPDVRTDWFNRTGSASTSQCNFVIYTTSNNMIYFTAAATTYLVGATSAAASTVGAVTSTAGIFFIVLLLVLVAVIWFNRKTKKGG